MGRVAVIGAGPAGIAAAVQLMRQGHDVRVFEQDRVGGTLWNAGMVENYPGFPGGITGRHLVRLMEEHFYDYIDGIIPERVDSIRKIDVGYEVSGEDYIGVILCTGTSPKRAGFPGEEELSEARRLLYGISFLERWQGVMDVGIIGGGEASMDMALSLAEAGMKVTIIHRSEPGGIQSLLETAQNEENITWHRGTVKEGRLHDDKAVLKLDEHEMPFDLVIVAVGRERCLPELDGMDLNNLPDGLFVAGDAARGSLGQTAMAVGDGVEAAIIMHGYLEGKQ